jgi:hypothetical protein
VGDILGASVKLPTVIFTALAAVLALFWLLSIVGVVDIGGGEEVADGLLDGALEPLGLADVPVIVVGSIIAVVGWFISVLAQIYLLDDSDGWALATFAVVVGAVAAAVSLGIAALAAPKLSRVFSADEAPSSRALVGRVAEVRSVTVTATSGYADTTWPDGRSERIDIRISQHGDIGEGALRTGDRVVIVSWDADQNVYLVAELPEELGE